MPLVSHHHPQLEYLNVLSESPLDSLHVGVNNVYPALTTLPWLPLGFGSHELVELLSYASPLFRLVHVDPCLLLLVRGDLSSDSLQNLCLVSCPRRLFALNLLNEKPAFLALLYRTPRD